MPSIKTALRELGPEWAQVLRAAQSDNDQETPCSKRRSGRISKPVVKYDPTPPPQNRRRRRQKPKATRSGLRTPNAKIENLPENALPTPPRSAHSIPASFTSTDLSPLSSPPDSPLAFKRPVARNIHKRPSVGKSPFLSKLDHVDDGAPYTPPRTPKKRKFNSKPHSQKESSTMSVTIAISKPVPAGQPLVWAEGRQALCESLPYYRAYQSGGYCSNGFAYGFMFDGHCHPRDYIDQTVVIARSGGGLSKNQASGAMVITEDQRATSSQVQSVMRSKQHFNPVVILLGAQNPLAPSKMPHAYNVLDWFKPTHVWAEKSDGKVVVRYRFEKLNPKLPSWWAPGPVPPVDDLGEHLPPQIEICQACQKPNPQVYVQGWMCLDPDCLMFWKLSDGREPDEAALTYDKTFLKQFTAWPNVVPPYSVRPDLMTLSPSPILGEDVSQQAAKGFVCPNCGRCNSREMWTEWRCQSTGCGFTHKLKHSLIPSHLLRDPYAPLSNNYPPSRDKWDYSFPCQVHFRNNYRIHRLSIPGTGGFIEHWIANKTVLEEKDGPDTMFEELQTIDIGLRRRALQSSQIKGPQLCQHFTVNFGMPYKFIAAAESNSFDDAPGTVRNARSRLNWVARQAVGSDVPGFNEVLAIGYFEKQDIDFHDDGEHGLGPTIATLSLGSPGTMTIRMKQKHWLGVSRTGLLTRDPPIPGCVKYEQRAAAHRELEELKVGNSPDYKAKVEAIPRELNLQTKHGSRVQADPIAELRLNHGDVVIMHGEKIQQYYEHSVSHEGKLRFALTCRYIQDNHLKEHERPNYAVKPDDVNYDGSKLPQFPSAAPSTCNPTD